MTLQEAYEKADKVWLAVQIGLPNSFWTWVPVEKSFAYKWVDPVGEREEPKWDYNEEYNDLWIGEFKWDLTPS